MIGDIRYILVITNGMISNSHHKLQVSVGLIVLTTIVDCIHNLLRRINYVKCKP